MGVGTPTDLIEGVLRGIDLFDCVMPTRNGRNALAFTSLGKLRIRNEQFKLDESPLDPECECPTCQQFTRGVPAASVHGKGDAGTDSALVA